mgnify:CR=1 FL=1
MHSGGKGALELGHRSHPHQQNAISSWPHREVFADRHRHDDAHVRASGAGGPHQAGSLDGGRSFHTNGADLASKPAQITRRAHGDGETDPTCALPRRRDGEEVSAEPMRCCCGARVELALQPGGSLGVLYSELGFASADLQQTDGVRWSGVAADASIPTTAGWVRW